MSRHLTLHPGAGYRRKASRDGISTNEYMKRHVPATPVMERCRAAYAQIAERFPSQTQEKTVE